MIVSSFFLTDNGSNGSASSTSGDATRDALAAVGIGASPKSMRSRFAVVTVGGGGDDDDDDDDESSSSSTL